MTNSTSSSVRKSITLESGVRNVVSVEQGSHYVLKGAEGAFWDECLAVRSGDDLIVRFADGTVLVLDGFFTVGAAVELPAENGTYQVLDAEAYGDTGSAVVHAVGEASTLSSLAAYDSAIADYVEAVLSAGESLPTAGGYAGGVENLFGVLGAAGGLGLAAAGAGGGGGSSGSFAPGQVNPGQSGVVVDGYISGAFVSRANGSGNTVRTNEQGRFEGLTGTGEIIVSGGMDMSTEQPFTGQLRAPSDATVITPLTTLVVELEEQGQARDAAIARVKAAFDLNDGFDLLNQDPVAQANEGNADALQVLKAGVQVATLLQAATGTEAGFEAGAKALADKVNVAGFDSTVFFTDRHELQSLVDDIVGSLPGTDVNSDFDATSAALQFVDMAKAQNATELADTQAIALIEQAPDRFNVPVGGEVPIARLTVTPGSTIATEAEAIEGAVRVLGVEGAIVTVTFTGPGGEVVKLLTGDGKAQHVSLTEADLAELGEGQITVSATQTLDGVRQTGAPAIRGFTLDTIAPEAPALALVEDTGTFAGITSNGQVNVTDLEEDATWEYSLDDGNTWTAGAGTSIAASAFGADGSKSVTVRQTDVAGNVSAASEALSFTLETSLPALTITDNVFGVASGPLLFTFSFSEDVVGFDASKITVEGGVAGTFNAVNGNTYTLVVTPNTTPNAGNVSVSVADGAVADLAGNALAGEVSASQAYEFEVAKDEEGNDIVAKDEDGNDLLDAEGNPILEGQAPEVDDTAPTLRITDNVAGVASGPVVFTFSFSEDVVGFDASKITVEGGVAGTFNAVNGNTYTLVVTPNTTPNAGNVSVSVADGAVADLAGNALAGAVSASQAYEFEVAKDEEGNDIVAKDEDGNDLLDAEGNPILEGQAPEVDETAPTLRITDNVAGVASGPVVFTFSFSEDVVGFDASKITVEGGVAGTFNAVNGNTYTLVVTPNTTPNAGNVSVSVADGAVADLAGNALAGEVSASQAYEFEVAKDAEGNDIVAKDEDGNDLLDADGNPILEGQAPEVDETAPTLRITDNVAGVASGPVVFTFSFSEDVVGFDASKVTVEGSVAGTFNAVNGNTYTLVVTPNTTPNAGNVSVSVADGAVADLAGNALAGEVSASQDYFFEQQTNQQTGETRVLMSPLDTTAPTLNITSSAGGTTAEPVTFTFRFSEDVTSFDISDVQITGGEASGQLVTVDARTYTLEVTPNTNQATGDIGVSVQAGAARDLAGNVLEQPATFTQAYDLAPPKPTLRLAEDTGSANDDSVTTNGQVMVEGLVATASWEYKVGSGEWTEGEGNSFTLNSTGEQSVQVRQTNSLGGATSAESEVLTFTFVPQPTQTVTIAPEGVISGQSIDADSVQLTGTISEELVTGQVVNVYNGTQVMGEATVNGTTWTFSAEGLALGISSFTARVEDVVGGHAGIFSPAFAINAMGDNAVTIASLTDAQGNAITDASTTQDTRPTLRGQLSAALAEGESVAIYNTAGETPMLLGQANVIGLSWSYRPSSPLEAGEYIFDATVQRGEVTLFSAAETISVTAEGAAPQQTVSDLEVTNAFGDEIASGQSTNATTVTLSGTLSAELNEGDVLAVYRGNTRLDEVAAENIVAGETEGTFSFSYTTELAVGDRSLTARVENPITGNGPRSDAYVVKVNTVAITNVVADEGQNIGVVADNSATDDRTPVLTGTIGTALGANEAVAIYNGSALLGNATVNGTNWTFTVPADLDFAAASLTAQIVNSSVNTMARYVLLVANDANTLWQPTEFRALDRDGNNVALDANVSTNASVIRAGELSNLVDGSSNSLLFDRLKDGTNVVDGTWILVDLGQLTSLGAVEYSGRTGGRNDRRANLHVTRRLYNYLWFGRKRCDT